MSIDPQDLLYTNQFISGNVINKEELNDETKNYKRYQKYIKDNSNLTKKYIQDDLYSDNTLNINKTMKTPWPPYENKNRFPMFNSAINDVVEDKYVKHEVTNLSLYSKDRNKSKYLLPNNYNLPLNRLFKNIEKIVLKQIIIPNTFTPVNIFNNMIMWAYPNVNTITNNRSNSVLIPSIDDNLIFSSYSNAVSTITSTDELINKTVILPGFYNLETFKKEFRRVTSLVLHNKVEEPYKSSDYLLTTPTKFTLDINPDTSICRLVNRIEELPILAIQTFDQDSDLLDEYDIFTKFSSTVSKTFDKKCIYITLRETDGNTIYFTDSGLTNFLNPFPLVLTKFPTVGGINGEYVNFTPFFDENLYNNKSVQNSLYSVSSIKFFDYIEIPRYSSNDDDAILEMTYKYVRFQLKLNTGNLNGKVVDFSPSANNRYIYPTHAETVILQESFKNILENCIINSNVNNKPYTVKFTGDIFNRNENELISNLEYPVIGRALPMKLIFNTNYLIKNLNNESSTSTECVKSIFHLLAWPIGNNADMTSVISEKPPYRFIHSNIDGIEVNNLYLAVQSENINTSDYVVPVKKLNLQLYNDKYYFRSDPFFFVKIKAVDNLNAIEDNIIRGIDSKVIQTEQYYNYPFYEDVTTNLAISTSDNSNINYFKKDTSQLLAKVPLNSIPRNNIIIYDLHDEVVFYNKPLEKLSELVIQLIKPDGKMPALGLDHSLTIEVHEIKEILKETLIDTKRGRIVSTGYKNI